MSRDDRKDQTPPHAPTGHERDGDAHPGVHPDGHADAPLDAPVDADAREQALAASFAAMLDRLTTGQTLPPAVTAEERALLATAGVVRASTRPVALAPERQRSLIDEAMAQARAKVAARTRAPGADEDRQTDGHGGGARLRTPGAPSRAPGRDDRTETHPDIIDLGERRRGRYFRALPWAVAIASVAAALVLTLWQSRTGTLAPTAPPMVAETAAPAPNAPDTTIDTIHRSRPADVLVGEIPRERADAARARIDMIYADRMIGYRDLRLRGGRL
jgi:hypothetical protein